MDWSCELRKIETSQNIIETSVAELLRRQLESEHKIQDSISAVATSLQHLASAVDILNGQHTRSNRGDFARVGRIRSQGTETQSSSCSATESVEMALLSLKSKREASIEEKLASDTGTPREGTRRPSDLQTIPDRRPRPAVNEDDPDLSRASSYSDVVPLALPPNWPTLSMRCGLDWHTLDAEAVERGTPWRSSGKRRSEMLNRNPDQFSTLSPSLNAHTEYRFVLSPDSTVRILFDLFSVLVLAVDLTLIPFFLAFAVPSNHRYVTMFTWATAIFWTVDILMLFNTGFFRAGVKEMNRWIICKRYLGGWFILDAMVVTCDWLSIALTFGDESLPIKLLRFLKLGRMLRVFGMVRIARLVRLCEDFFEWSSSGSFVVMTRVVGMLCVSFWVIHLLGCIFYYVGTLEDTDTGSTWLSTRIEVGGQYIAYQDLDKTYLYWSAFHWSMAQMTLGATELVAFNSCERVLSVLLMFFGLLFGSTLVSSLSATLIGIQMRALDQSKLARDLDRYLQQHQVSIEIAMLVRKSALPRLTRPKHILESDVRALRDLPAALLSDLKFDIYQKHLMKYPFFRLVSSLTQEIVPVLCQCVTHLVVHPGDEVFKSAAESNAVHYVVQGALSYVQQPMTSTVIQTQHTEVAKCAWVSEAAFWIQWIHVGSLRAMAECELITFDALGVVEGLVKDRVIREVSCAWALQFQQSVCEARPPLSDFPTDLVVPRAEFCEIISRMGEDFRTWSGHPANAD